MKRALTRTAPEWCECDCGSVDVEQTTFADCPAGQGYDGDDLRCRECGLEGVVSVEEDDIGHVIWNDEVGTDARRVRG